MPLKRTRKLRGELLAIGFYSSSRITHVLREIKTFETRLPMRIISSWLTPAAHRSENFSAHIPWRLN
jgi:hypothetical protein